MKRANWGRGLAVCVFVMACMLGAQGVAETRLSDGYVLDDYDLDAAGDLVDICTLEEGHIHYEAARAFCFGFFEGAKQYDDLLGASPAYDEIVCAPKGMTRTEAVNEFLAYMQANPQYQSESPIDAVFRAMIAKWPCN